MNRSNFPFDGAHQKSDVECDVCMVRCSWCVCPMLQGDMINYSVSHTISTASLVRLLVTRIHFMISRKRYTEYCPVCLCLCRSPINSIRSKFSKWKRIHETLDSSATGTQGAAGQLFLQRNPHPISGRNVNLLIIFNKYIDLIDSTSPNKSENLS